MLLLDARVSGSVMPGLQQVVGQAAMQRDRVWWTHYGPARFCDCQAVLLREQLVLMGGWSQLGYLCERAVTAL